MRILSLIIILVLALYFAACKERPESHENNQVPKEKFSVRDGKRLFIHYCSPCHGESGDGFGQYLAYGLEPKPPDFTSPDFLEKRSDEVLFLTISEGTISLGKSNLCPPWGKTFRQEEIYFVAEYVQYLNDKANVKSNNTEHSDE